MDYLYLAKELSGKSFIEQIEFAVNEWIDGWKRKQGFGKLMQCPSFYVRFFLWIMR